MAEVVLVHGIAQEQKSADGLEAAWLPSLAGGVRTAGHPSVADRLWRSGQPGDARMAFYGDLFLPTDQQGTSDDLPAPELAEAIAMAWLTRAAEDATDESDRQAARREIDYLTQRGETQGARAALRPVINSLTRLRPFARLGVALAGRVVVKSLAQVTRYLTDEETRARIQRRVLDLVDENTKVIVAHSLGSVVAYEVAHQLGHPLPLLVTMGSPLGLRAVVYERLRPQPPMVPKSVLSWVNIADRDDLVAARPDLTPLFADPAGVLAGGYTVDNGAKPHDATFYLAKRQIGEPVGRALS
ncbi:hypothetical protein [Actinocrispum wychmicini]|uniref:PGAP1-like protein n=1 Tax=Actinocrispum wychmicini TaxID=1213861 RepID=A0A4R2J6E3_9PSEU|nr:hypothetical protein [Actinocrispum wychmicini]TCO53092.1 hypothetical protein EV192_111289 [Actinocrispum wychmicini]